MVFNECQQFLHTASRADANAMKSQMFDHPDSQATLVEIEPTARRFLISRIGGWPKNLPMPQRLGTLVWNPHCRQVSGSIATCQLLSIPPIRLYSITNLDRDQRGCDNLALDAQFCQLPVPTYPVGPAS
jgi:hypothetical protein